MNVHRHIVNVTDLAGGLCHHALDDVLEEMGVVMGMEMKMKTVVEDDSSVLLCILERILCVLVAVVGSSPTH